jgi:hypothetical protein
MLHIGVVDTYYQGLGGLRRLDCLSVRRVKPVGLEFSTDSQRVTADCHVACTHIAEAAGLKGPGRCAMRHPSLLRDRRIDRDARALLESTDELGFD